MKDRPERCHGTKRGARHAAYCRPGRPRCRWRRREAGICRCGAYHYPHRDGSGRCGEPEALDAWAHGPASEERARLYESFVPDAPTSAVHVFADLLEVDFIAGGVA